ncbi:MAG TPA: DNA polymerase III subunit alpha [Bacteroidetes bacterium]|nr:DNA polymerase III subunit alpha [Bacteroidota bacterium]
MPGFVHLHNHTEFSLLDGAAKIDNLCKKAADCGMPAVAITDHGNMYGVPKFVLAARKHGLKPIVGCEFYICAKPISEKNTKTNPRYHQILWAKNAEGYKNLSKLCSYGYTDGFYYKPRIDKDTLAQHSEGLIGSTCCLAGEVNRAIIDKSEEEAEQILNWYIDLFGKEDYYIEIQRHGLGDMEKCNSVLLRWAKKYGLKTIATNDVHYVNEEDSDAHDLLLALQTASDYYDPNRFRFTDDHGQLNRNFYFKTPEEMGQLFSDVPQALDYTLELAEKCDFEMNLNGDMFLPNYKVPEGFTDMDEYLAHLTWEGAKIKYPEMTSDLSERILYELKIMKKMGYAGYFLIVQSFTTVARQKGVYVGPGRGSAAGSVVAYCLGIINVDPMRYQLLFERFLNPDRVSPPDIDIDFDDEGRQEVIDYVVEEYGRRSVSQVITYGTMGVKTALRDVGRTLNIPLTEVNRIAKMVPDRPGINFKKALSMEHNPDFSQELKKTFTSPDPNIRKMMKFAQTLEGTARHTGVHACAVIIAPSEITNFVPIATAKDKSLVTQYDGPMAEKVGLLKMDFLGLKTLSIIKTCINQVKARYGVVIDAENIDITDKKTFELYQRGETVATFQFESEGMRKYLKQLKPTDIEDLIAMNALYRPGPMDNIPTFVARKHGREATVYPHDMLEPLLNMTYGIMVYQEQIMQVAQKMASYSLGQADLLRRAMGKKKHDVMAQERIRFVKGAKENGVDEKKATEVFDTMEKFASYGFNKSHAAAYSILAFQTAFLKAHYPSEYMASVLTHNVSDITKITFFIEECRRMGILVLSPCVNESGALFTVNDNGDIRFGLNAIKGVGHGVVEALVTERAENGPYSTIFEMTKRIPMGTVNRKVMEALAYSGAFDAFEEQRSAYFDINDGGNVLERAVSYGNKYQAEINSNQASLFGGMGAASSLAEPKIPICEEWTLMERLNFEKDVIGFYLSGHPLDTYKMEIKSFTSCGIVDLDRFQNKEVKIAGIVTKTREGMTKRGNKYAIFSIEDFSASVELALFGDDYAKFRFYLDVNHMLFVSAKSIPSFRDPSVFELKVTEIRFLADAFKDIAKSLVLDIPLERINGDLISKLETLFLETKGTCKLSFNIVDSATRSKIPLSSRTMLIQPSSEMVKVLETYNIGYSLK